MAVSRGGYDFWGVTVAADDVWDTIAMRLFEMRSSDFVIAPGRLSQRLSIGKTTCIRLRLV